MLKTIEEKFGPVIGRKQNFTEPGCAVSETRVKL
jgi:hypothetical protein